MEEIFEAVAIDKDVEIDRAEGSLIEMSKWADEMFQSYKRSICIRVSKKVVDGNVNESTV